MLGTKKIKGKKKEERKDNMEKMLVQILDGLKDIKEEIYIIKEENREEHKVMKQDIVEIKDKQRKMEEDIVEIKEEQKIIRQEQKEIKEEQKIIKQEQETIKAEIEGIKEKVAYNTELIQKMTKDIIDSIDIVKRTVTRINNNQIGQIRHVMLQETVNFEKNKEQDAVLALHHERIGKCEENLGELLQNS